MARQWIDIGCAGVDERQPGYAATLKAPEPGRAVRRAFRLLARCRPMSVNAGDTAWVLGSAALVLFMTPGLALFYGGMVRSKNVLGIMIQNFAAIAVVGVVWAAIGYTLAFGPDIGGGLLGGLKFAGLANGHTQPAGMNLTIPPYAFAAFQMMFAIITVALLTGAGADRLSFKGFLVLAVLWTIVVYAPIAHWVFSPEGWLAKRGALDFAGGNVVEIDSGRRRWRWPSSSVGVGGGRKRSWRRIRCR